MEWSMEGDALTINFSLGKGIYATSILREIGDFVEA